MAAFGNEIERDLQNTCYDLSIFEAPYVDDDRTEAYSGIMFDLVTKSEPLEILTFEVDVRLSEVKDFSVEVYRTKGGFQGKINDPEQWTLLANTQAIASPDGRGVIIPQRSFENVNLGRNERASFYIQMKGPWIENKAVALIKTGELAAEGEDFRSYAGVGTSSLFPISPETTTDPQFSGKVYYQKAEPCKDTTTSSVEMIFVAGSSFDHSSFGPIGEAVEDVTNRFLMKEDWFEDKAARAGLRPVDNIKTTLAPYNGDCPWTACSVFTSELKFDHSTSLSDGELRYNVYRYIDAFQREMQNILKAKEFVYLGFKSAATTFSISMSGVPDNTSLGSEHVRYLLGSFVSFFQSSIQKYTSFVTVFEATVDGNQDIFRNLRARRQLDGTIIVEGTMYGGRSAPLDKEEFVVQVQRSFREEEKILLQYLKYGSVVPQSDLPDEEVLSYFDNLNGFSGTFEGKPASDTDWGGKPFDHSNGSGGGGLFGNGNNKDDPKLDGDKINGLKEDAGNSPIFILIAAVVGGLLVLSVIVYFAYEQYKKRKYKEDLEKYRKKAKAERKLKRLKRGDSSDALREDAKKALKDLDDDNGKTASSKSDSDGAPPESARPSDDEGDRGRGRSKRDTASLPDSESLSRARSRSHERTPAKHSLLASFMEDENKKKKPIDRLSGSKSLGGDDFRRAAPSRSVSDRPGSRSSDRLASFMEDENRKKKPGDKFSGTRSLGGDDFRRSVPARSVSDRPRSQNSGVGPDRSVQRSDSSSELDQIRASLQRRNMDCRGSPRSGSSRSQHSRSMSGDIMGTMSRSTTVGSRSAHARSITTDNSTSLYGSATTPRRGTRANSQHDVPVRRSRSNSPSRRPPGRSQSYNLSQNDFARAPVQQSRSGDLSSMRQNRSNDLSSMRQNSDQIRRGRRRDDRSAGQLPPAHGNSSHSRGQPARAQSFEASPRLGSRDRGVARARSGGF